MRSRIGQIFGGLLLVTVVGALLVIVPAILASVGELETDVRMRERFILTPDNPATLSGVAVSLSDTDPPVMIVGFDGEELCRFERPRFDRHLVQALNHRIVVAVRKRIEDAVLDVRVDRIPRPPGETVTGPVCSIEPR